MSDLLKRQWRASETIRDKGMVASCDITGEVAAHIEQLQAENTALREQVARMPVLIGYGSKSMCKTLLFPWLMPMDITVVRNADDLRNVPLYLDPLKRETQ